MKMKCAEVDVLPQGIGGINHILDAWKSPMRDDTYSTIRTSQVVQVGEDALIRSRSAMRSRRLELFPFELVYPTKSLKRVNSDHAHDGVGEAD